jgi:hypothetical protein
LTEIQKIRKALNNNMFKFFKNKYSQKNIYDNDIFSLYCTLTPQIQTQRMSLYNMNAEKCIM